MTQPAPKDRDDVVARERQESATAPKGGKRSIFKKLLALLVGCIVAGLLTELLLLLTVGEQPKFPRHVVEAPWGIRYNEPGSRYRHKSADVNVSFRINNQGIRADQDYLYPKPAGVVRILSLGDSFTIGYEVDQDRCFSQVLERELSAAGYQAQVLNAGVSGFSNAEECVYLERELIKYDPDVVVVSFYINDIADNLRTGLFTLDDQGKAVEWKKRYVPAGKLGNFLNTNWFFNLLSERSNAFVFFKEKATRILKRRMVEMNERNLEQAQSNAPESDSEAKRDPADAAAPDETYPRDLVAAIFARMHRLLSEKGIPLVVQSIPAQPGGPDAPLLDLFPAEQLDFSQPGLRLLAMKKLLEPYRGKEPLYHRRSHSHWTPFVHELSGKALARLILENALLR